MKATGRSFMESWPGLFPTGEEETKPLKLTGTARAGSGLVCEAMVNNTIANALDTIQVKVVPFNSRWNTGIALPVKEVKQKGDIFPTQEYDWTKIEKMIEAYVEVVVLTSKSSYVII